MPRNISQDMRDQIYSTEMQFVPLVILDVLDDDLNVFARIVNNNESIEFDGNVYEASSFKFVPPSESEGEVETAKLSIANTDRRFVEIIRSIKELIRIDARVVLVGPSSIDMEAGPWEFVLSNVNYNTEAISGTLTYDFQHKQSLSTIRYTINNFPTLVQR